MGPIEFESEFQQLPLLTYLFVKVIYYINVS